MLAMANPDETEDHILSAAFELGCEQGANALGSRNISRHASITASAINYHFGSSDQLKAAVAKLSRLKHNSDMQHALTEAADLPRHLRSMGGFTASLAARMVTIHRGRTLLLEELGVEYDTADGSPSPFWITAAQSLGSANHSAIWELFFVGVLRFAVLDSDPVAASMWIYRAAQRLDARLEGLSDQAAAPSDPMPIPDLLQESKTHSARSQLIIETAAQILLENGTISHRAIAQRANISLGSTTYFFESKSDIILEAFKHLYRETFDTFGNFQRRYGTPFMADGTLDPYYSAVHRIALTAARDPLLLPLAKKMRDSRGQSSTAHLREVGVPHADRLDGLIWSLFHGAAQHCAAACPASQRQVVFSSRLDTAWQAIFGDIRRPQ